MGFPRDMHCTMAKFPRHLEDFHGHLTASQENPGFASLGSAQDSHHHDDTFMFPFLSTWLAIENGCKHISLHTAKTNYIWKFVQTMYSDVGKKDSMVGCSVDK